MEKTSKNIRIVESLAESYGVKLDIRQGSRHKKIYYEGKLVGILPTGNGKGTGRHMMNAMAQVRRAIEERLSIVRTRSVGKPEPDNHPNGGSSGSSGGGGKGR